jgi:hypothetical protein
MPLPLNFGAEDFLNRDVTGTFEEELEQAAEIHERMRSVGIHVVKYEIAIEDSNNYLRPEYVDGLMLEDVDTPTYRREMGKLAVGWHRFYEEAVQDRMQYALFDAMSPRQFMYGTTESQPQPTTQLVDIEPFLMPFDAALKDPLSGQAGELHDELRRLRDWAEPYWQAANLPEFAVPRLTPEQQAAHDQPLEAAWRAAEEAA